MRSSIKFQDQGNRDREFLRLKSQGYKVRKRSSRNQSISPDYVADFSGTRTPNGFGGSSPTWIPVLYIVEIEG